MLKRFSITFLSLVLLCGFGIDSIYAQDQPPLIPPLELYGTAYVDGSPLTEADIDKTISIRMERLLLIFLDSPGSQGLIGDVIGQLDVGTTTALQQAFINSPYCQSRGILLSAGAVVMTQTAGAEWLVNDQGNTYTVIGEGILIWNGTWIAGNKLEVYQHNGEIASYTMGSDFRFGDYYVAQIPMSSGEVFGGLPPSDTYLLRDPGKAVAGEKANIYINNILITDPTPPYTVNPEGFVEVDIYAPSAFDFILDLPVGWSLVSFPMNKCFYVDTPPTDQPPCVELVDVINTLGFSSLADWFSTVLTPNNPGGSAWSLVIGTEGVMDSELPSSSHSLKYMSSCSAYWVKIYGTAGGAVLSLTDQLYDLDCAIPLKTGWNLAGYPSLIAYYDTDLPPAVSVPPGTTWIKVPRPVGAHVFGSIIGKLNIVIGQNGVYDPSLPPNSSSLRYILPGDGFWVKMDEAWNLTYPEP